jgi:natural product biosynthesis luciferase-like monooxygenase protein/amino acid adenylation domain-containing protein
MSIATTLQGIFGRVLRIEPRDIDVEAPFLELGADSLALVEALRGIQEAYGIKLTIRQLFEQLPSISVLAGFLEANVGEGTATPKTAAPVVAEEALITPALFSQPPPRPPGEEGVVSPKGLPGGSSVERVLSMQIQAFNQLVAQQLQALGARGAAGRAPVPAPAAPAPSPAPIAKPVLPTHLGKVRAGAEMTERQRAHLDALISRFTRKTAKSKEMAEAYRPWLADSRSTVGFRPATKEMLYPLARHRSQGSRLWDVDSNEYVDVTMGMGVHLFGHDPEFLRETISRQVAEGFELGPRSAHSGEVAALFCELTGMERATFTNSGTEACMTAIRLARARTGRTKIVMFAGSYHGHSDATLAQTQEIDGELRSFPVAPGVPPKVAEDVLVLDYGSPQSLEIIRRHRHELAAVMVEPIQSRRPEVQPRDFLHELRKLTAESGIALIFDEMICGFRLHLGGAQAHFGVRADIATYGKVVGGGLPIGVVAGSADYMDGIDGGPWRYGDDSRPERETTFFGGTFCQHPLAMAAAKRVLTYLKEQGSGLQETLNARTARFAERLNEQFASAGAPLRALHAHSLFRFQSAANIDLLYYHLVNKGVYVWEWRNCFLSTAHTDADLDFVVRAVGESVAELQRGGFLPEPPAGGKAEPALGFWDRQGKPAIAPVAAVRTDRTDPTDPTDPSDSTAEYSSREVRFGLYFFGNYAAEFATSKYDLLFDCARFADRHSFASLWFPERHFHPFGGLSPNPSVLGAALARETERIALRAGSVVLPLHHPVRVAEEWSLVDNLSGGRVGLSCASGWHPNDFALAPESFGPHRELMFERLETVQRLWRGEAVRLRDGAGSEVDLRIFPLPARRDLPVWITIVNNPDTYRRAGEIGAGVLTNLMGQTVETLAASIRIYRGALAAAGHPPSAGHVAVLLHTFVGPDATAAVETARRPFYRYLESSVGLLKTMIASEGLAVDLESLAPEDLEYMLGLAYQRYVSTSALIGSPETCAPIVERMREIGVDEIACLVDFGVDREAVAASLPWLDGLRRQGAAPARVQSEPIDLPLTEVQEDLYTVVQLGEAASVAYNEPGTLGLHGPLDLALLRKALQQVVNRHEALRTILPSPGPAGDPIQRILPGLMLTVPLVDVSGLPPERREEAASAWAEAEGRRPFDFARGPLIRASVLRLGSREHRLFLAVHHLMADGLSVVVILKDVLAIYEAERAGRAAALPAPMQLREYVAWTRRERDFSEDEAWWREIFSGTLPVFEPPTDRPRPPERTFRGAGAVAELPPELRRAVHKLGRRRGATFFITLLAAWSALLHRWTGQDDVVIGVPTARRPLEGGDRLVGHCVDLVPIRSQVGAEGETFASHLVAVRNRVFGAHDHGEYPFARLVRALNPPRDLSRGPLVNVLFNLDQDLDVTRAGGLEIAGRSSGVHGVKLDLAVHALERGEGLRLDLEYCTDLFDGDTVHRLLGHFRTLLEGAAADPDGALAALPLLSAAERRQLVEWESAPPPAAVPDLVAAVEAMAAQAPEALALRGCPGQRDLSYGELVDLASRLAHHLRSLGAGPEARVAICLDRSPEMLVAVLGTLAAGAAYVPLDPGYPAERLAVMLADAAPAVVLTRRTLAGALPPSGAHVVWVEDLGTFSDLPEGTGPLPSASPENLAYVLYTSGSTGRPKGVAMGRGALANLIAWQQRELPEPRRTLQFAPLSFDASFQELFSTWTTGGTLVLIGEDERRDPAELYRRIRSEQVERIFLPFVALQQLAEAAREQEPPGSLKEVITAGEQLRVTPALAEMFRRLGGTRLHNHYGPTETHVATAHVLGVDPAAWPLLPAIGRPIAGARAVVVDREGQPVPVGVAGELLLGGAGLAWGYLGRPDLTAERFLPDQCSAGAAEHGARLYRTGDQARWLPGGDLEFLGRIDDQVKIRGFRVEPGEVEAVLAAHPQVREAAVVVREEGTGDRRLIAYYVAGTKSPSSLELRAFLAGRLPDYLVPAAFVAVPSLPRTPSGKVDRRALAADRSALEEDRTAPESDRSLLADLLCGHWAAVLGRERVEPHEGFFDLGGHSLLATRLLSRVRDAFGVDLPLRTLFELPSPAALARQLDREIRGRQGLAAAIPILPAVAAEGQIRRAPLSFAQERVWFFDRLAPGSIVYNLPVALRIAGGGLRPAALAAALGEIVRRHDALRTGFAASDGDPEQVVSPFAGLALPRVDLSGLPGERATAEAGRIEREEGRRPFDLAAGPLLRPFLLRLAADAHTLLLAVHHIVADGWSFGVLGRELAALYRAAMSGQASPLPPLPVQYSDFAVWQRRWLQGEVLETLLAAWRRRLAGHPGVLELPTDRPRPAEQSFRGAIEPLPLAPDLARELRDGIRDLGRRQGATPFMIVLSVFQVLLQRYTGQEDLLVGTPIAHRNRSELEGLIGFFVNTLPVRTDLGGDPAFSALLGRVREASLWAYAHQDLPFEKLVEALAPDRGLSRNPLVQATFAFQNTPRADRELAPGLIAVLEDVDPGISKFDLTGFLEETDGGLAGGVEYAADLFDAATIQRLAGHFLNLLRTAVALPDSALSELSILAPEEERQVVEAWNATAADIPRETPVHRLFEAVAARDPQAPAVLWDGGSLSYGELDRWANRLARRLRAQGVGPETAVALDLERSPELVVAMLAVLKAGGFYVPLDAADPEERRAMILEDAGAPVRIDREDVNAAESDEPDGGLDVRVDAGSLAYVIYTSGSTGRPKGVAIPHRAIVRLAVNTDYLRLGPGDRVAHASNTAFDAATFEVWSSLLAGAALVVIPREVVLSPATLGAEYRRLGITAAFLTAALFNEVVRADPASLGGVRDLIAGGEALSLRRTREARAAMPEQRLINGYGPTESTTFAAWHPVAAVPEGAVSIPIGLPLANTRIHLLDRHLRPVPVGVPGELCIAGEGLARGYLHRPDLTAERFVPDPFDSEEGRLYRTGDLARRREDGAVEFLGRIDSQVKIRGFRVELGEIEAALAQAPGVRECAVVAREEDGGRRLVAWVALEEGAAPDLRGFLRQRLPEAMIPAAFAVLDTFPRTASGKVDRRALALLDLPVGASDAGPAFEAPRTPVEEIVAGAWSQVLGRERVGRRDDFFGLGGHSLLASRVLSRLRGMLGVDLPLRAFFREPTVAGLARLADQARQERRGSGPPPLVHVSGDGWARLAFAQERLWLVDQLQPGSTAYDMALPLVLTGRLDVPALGRALEEIARRHEVLRTRFVAAKDGPVQVVEPVSWLGLNPLARVDLAGLPPEAAHAELSRLGDLRQPFDLARGPLFRAVLVRVSEDEHALLSEMHHAVCDGWSLDVMTRELSALYGAFAAGRPSPLPELPIQYADFARWQRQWLQGEVVEAELAWWRGQLGENPPPLALPTDRPRPAQPPAGGFRSESRVLLLPPELASGLAALARGRGATLFIVLLAGFQTLLHRHTQQEKIAVGSPVAGRTRLEVEELIGLFVNTLVLAADFSGFKGEPTPLTVSSLLDRVRDSTLGAFDHQDLPFEQLVAALARHRDPSRQPLFQVMFVLQNNAQSEIDLPGLNLAVLPGSASTALFDLTLSAVEMDGGIGCGFNYAAELFDPATIVRLLEQYRRLLEAWVDDPGQLVDRSPLFSGAERHQLERKIEILAETPDAAKEALAEARRAELDRRRSEVASRRGQLSGDRKALLRKWVGGAAAAPVAREEAPPEVSPLVKLQTTGTRTPIFLVHAAGGLVHDFVNLAQRLDPDQPFYALQSPALAGGEHFATVPEMAAHYLEAVRSVQPRGPYRLGGYCIGGAVAFEMARQLRDAGEETENLLLFDSPGPPSEPPPPLDEAALLASFARTFGDGAEVSADELRALPPEAWIDRVLERVREIGRLDASFDAAQLKRRWEVMKRNTRAILPFVPAGRLPLGAVLFRAVEQVDELRGLPFLGWERWLEGPIEVVDVEGGHLGVFLEPAVEAVARELRDRTAVGAAV